MAVDTDAARRRFAEGGVIPAHPLALDAERRIDERRQRALSRYYVESGSVGIAVGVHSTQFELHSSHTALLEPVLRLSAEVADEYRERRPLLIAGVAGPTRQAVAEAELAARCGYDFVLLTPYRAERLSDGELVDRARHVAEVLPVIGFCLQEAIGGRRYSSDFWRRFAQVPGVLGVKIAPFDRYATGDVVRGVAASGRDDITLYTGNDDSIAVDLISEFEAERPDGSTARMRFAGGLLGQWAVWTRRAVEMHERARHAVEGDEEALRWMLKTAPALTDANGAVFDVAHRFAGCIPGIHEVLRRHGLLAGTWCLNEREVLSPGQSEELDRIWRQHPELRDDDFIAENLDRWLA